MTRHHYISGLSPAGYGVFIAVGGLGSVGGGLLADRIRTPAARLLTVVLAAPGVAGCYGVLALASRPVTAALAMVAFGLVISLFNVVAMSVRQARTPSALLGRVVSVHRFVCWGALPIGALVAGLVASAVGTRWAVATCAGVVLLTWCGSLRLLARSRTADYDLTGPPSGSDTGTGRPSGSDPGTGPRSASDAA